MKKMYSFYPQWFRNFVPVVIGLVLLCQANLSVAQTDTEFWFAPPEIAQGTAQAVPPTAYDRPVFLRITGGSLPSSVTISQPANPLFGNIVIAVAANATQSVDLTPFLSSLKTTPSNSVLNTGLLIKSDNPISVYYDILATATITSPPGTYNLNSEFYSLKGKSALGTFFYTPFQNYLDNSLTYNPPALSSFDIVATDDNTTVKITPSNNIDGHLAGVEFSIVLNKGQTYSAKAVTASKLGHLGGSKIISNKCIAVTMKDDQLFSGGIYNSTCVDQIGDQLIPVNNLNNTYIVLRTDLSTSLPEQVFVVATENGTQISKDNFHLTTLNAGQSTNVNITAPATKISSTKNFYALQIGGVGCEIGAALLPGLASNNMPLGANQYGFVRTTNEALQVNILAPSSIVGSFLVNGFSGVITGGDFTSLLSAPGWSYARKSLTSLPLGVNNISNSAGNFQVGVINGGAATGASYGYFSQFPNNSTCATTADCGLTTSGQYFGGFENGNNIPGVTGSDLYNGLPRNGSYQIVKKVSDLGGGGYLNINPHSGNWFFASHTSNNASEKVWYAKVATVPGKTYSFCAYVTLLKNLGNGAKYILGVYANENELNTGRVTFDWTKICGTFTATAATTELSIRDPKKGLFFVAMDDICFTEGSTPPAGYKTVNAGALKPTPEIALDELTVKAFPNPTTSTFSLSIQSNNRSDVSIRITDAFGRTLNIIRNVQVNAITKFGNELKPGNYFAEITQGSVKRLVKLVKL